LRLQLFIQDFEVIPEEDLFSLNSKFKINKLKNLN